MSDYPLPAPITITETDELIHLVESLHSCRLIGMDMESNGLFNYHERVCLIQLSTIEQDYLIDPFMVEDMSPLGRLTANPKIEFVFHASEYDIGSMKRDFGFEFANIFDTMIAARSLALKKIGLADVVEHYFGVEIDKSHQKANWTKRPLRPAAKRYAQMDTHFLPALRDILYQELQAKNMLEEAKETFEKLCQTAPMHKIVDLEAYWHITEAKHLSHRQMACLRELYRWREQEAEHQNVPRHKVMGDSDLVALAKYRPQSIKQLQQRNLISFHQIDRYGKKILKVLETGAEAELPKRPPRIYQNREVMKRYNKLKDWRKKRAEQRGVESDVIIQGQVLWHIAEAAPRTLEELAALQQLGTWRLTTYGSEILKVLQGGK